MNVGIVTTWFERGAAYVSRAYREALSARHRVFIYARAGEEYATDDPTWNQPYVTWGKRVENGGNTAVDWADFAGWISELGIEVLIFNEQTHWGTILKCLDLGVKTGAYVDYYTAETVPFFGLYDFLLCNTRRHHSIFATHPQAVYIPWGTDCSLFRPREEPNPGGGVRFFHSAGMGGLHLRKGTDLLGRAFQRVEGAASLTIHSQVGVEQYGEAAALIERDPRIRFIEGTTGAPGLYHLGDVYVYPTKLEGIGLTIAEALACGLPVITTDQAPMNEFVQEDLNGTLVAVERTQRRSDGYYWPESICSEAALAQAMQSYVDSPEKMARQKGQARAYAEAHLEWRKNSRDVADLVAGFGRLKPKPEGLRRRVARYQQRESTRRALFRTYGPVQPGRSLSGGLKVMASVVRYPELVHDRPLLYLAASMVLGEEVLQRAGARLRSGG